VCTGRIDHHKNANSPFDHTESVYIYDNEISGSLPISLGLLSNLEQFRANDNEISGSIPEEIGILMNLSTSKLAFTMSLL
jgi:hypothetical protein